MKNQYFGEARDYFKYDVLDRLASDLDGIETLTCLWMLTRSDRSNQGKVTFVPDPELTNLTAFFHDRLDPRDDARCQVSEMAYFFADRPFRFFSYRDSRADFGWSTRASYFRAIPAEALRRAVVFFDPDTGMEPRTCKRRPPPIRRTRRRGQPDGRPLFRGGIPVPTAHSELGRHHRY
jgi:hypothetical protein